MAKFSTLDEANVEAEAGSKRHCPKDLRIRLPEEAVQSLLQSFQAAEQRLAAAEVSEQFDAAQQELQVVASKLWDLAQLLKSRTDQVDAVLANASASDAEAPGLERLLEARKRLKEIEEEKVMLEALKDQEERNVTAWSGKVKEVAQTAQKEGCRAKTLVLHAQKLAQDKREEEAAERARHEAEEKARREAEEKARREAEEKARREAEEKARREAEEKARREAEEKARREAEEKARREAEEKARREAEEKARREAEEKARREAEEKARREAEENLHLQAQEMLRREAEEKLCREAEEKLPCEAEEKLRSEGEGKAGHQAEEKSHSEDTKACCVGQDAVEKPSEAEELRKQNTGCDAVASVQMKKPESLPQPADRLFVRSTCSKVTGEYHRIESDWQGRQAFQKQNKEKIYLVWSPHQAGHWTFTLDPSREEVLARSLQVSLTSMPDELMPRWTTAPWGTRGNKLLVHIQRG